jgi:hypothetical protein
MWPQVAVFQGFSSSYPLVYKDVSGVPRRALSRFRTDACRPGGDLEMSATVAAAGGRNANSPKV